MIFKLQRPLNGDGPILAYSQGRSNVRYMSQTPGLLAFFGRKPKVYVDGDIEGENLVIKRIADDQTW